MKQLSFLCCGNRRLGRQHPFPSQEGSLAGGVHASVSLRSLQFPAVQESARERISPGKTS